MKDIVDRLNPLIEGVRSDKVKLRESATKELVDLLLDRRRVAELVDAGVDDPTVFTSLLKAVFRCVDEEKKTTVKKGIDKAAAATLRRLSDSTSLLRTIITHIGPHINKRNLLDTFKHVLAILEFNGTVFEPVALDYLKTLKTLFSHQQHFDNLSREEWEGLVCMLLRAAFDEDLGGKGVDVLEGRFTADEASGKETIEVLGGGDGEELIGRRKKATTIFLNDEEEEDESDLEDGQSSTSKKRKRATSSRPTQSSRSTTPGRSSHPPRASSIFNSTKAPQALGFGKTSTISQIQITIFSLLLTLFQQPHTLPLLSFSLVPPTAPSADGADVAMPFPPSNVGLAILYKLLRFLLVHPIETSAHLNVVKSINLVFRVVHLNQLRPVALFADRLLPSLLKLWTATKTKEMKEQLVVALKLVFAFVSRDLPDDFGGRERRQKTDAVGSGWSAAERLERMREVLDGEVESRWAMEGLGLDSLRLEGTAGKPGGAFVTNTIQYGPKFSPAQAMAWAILELQSDVYAALIAISSQDVPIFASTPSKRRRTDKGIVENLLDQVDISLSSAVKVARLQILLFLIERHPDSIAALLKTVVAALVSTLSNEESSVQSWAFLCLAALAEIQDDDLVAGSSSSGVALHGTSPFASPSKGGHQSDVSNLWEQAWAYALRRTTVPAICRTASYAALKIGSHGLVLALRLQSDIETCLRNLEVQGPSFPFDSVCAFLCFALKITSQNVRMYRLSLEDSVLAWLVGTWSVLDGTTKGFNVRSRLENHTPGDVLQLLGAINRFEYRATLLDDAPLPESPVVDHVVEEVQTSLLRDFVLYNRVHEAPTTPFGSSSASTTASRHPSTTTFSRSDELKELTGRPRKTSEFLLKSVEALLGEWETPDTPSAATLEKVRRSLDLAAVAVAFEGSLELNNIAPSRKTVKRACALVLSVLPFLKKGRMRLVDAAVAVKGLETFVRVEHESDESERSTLIGPGPMTGIRRDLLPVAVDREEETRRDAAFRQQLLRVMWQGSDLQDLFAVVIENVQLLLYDAVGLKRADTVAEDVDMDDAMIASVTHDAVDIVPMATFDEGTGSDPGLHFPSRCADWLVSTSLDTIIGARSWLSGTTEPPRHRDLFDDLAACDGVPLIVIGNVVSKAVQEGRLHVSGASAVEILGAIGHFLSTYQFKRDDHLHSFAISFLKATTDLWVEASTTRTDFGSHAREQVEYLARQMITGKIRSPALRIQLLDLLAHFSKLDPDLKVWSLLDSEAVPCAVHFFAIGARDVDVQVRYKAVTSLPRLFDFVTRLVDKPFVDYNQAAVDSIVEGYEQGLTSAVFLANVLVRSTVLRRAAYFHFLDLQTRGGSLPHLQAVSQAVARALGFANPFELWKVYGADVILTSLKHFPDTEWKPSAALIGSSSQQEYARAILQDLGPLLIGKRLYGRFNDLVLASGRPREVVLVECVSRTLAQLLCNTTASYGSVPGSKQVRDIRNVLEQSGCKTSVSDLAANHLATLLTESFSELINPAEILEDLSDSDPAQAAVRSVFQEISRPSPSIYRWDSLLTPRSTSKAIFDVFHWLMLTVKDIHMPSVAFNVIYRLFSRIGRSALLIEQMRGVYSLSFFVACCHSAFDSPDLLRNLLHLSLVLMEQEELVPVVEPLLLWGLERCLTLGGRTVGFTEVFLRVANLADRFDSRESPLDLAQVGIGLLTKVEEILSKLHSGAEERWEAVVENIVVLWPRPLYNVDLQQLGESFKVRDLSKVLLDHSLSINKLPLVHRFKQRMPDLDKVHRREFSSNWFWQFKASLPPTSDLAHRLDQLDDFGELLRSNRIEAPSLMAIEQLPKLTFSTPRQKVAGDIAKFRVLLALVDQLGADDVQTINTTYSVLLGIAGDAQSLDRSFRSDMPTEARQQFDLLGEAPARPHGLPASQLLDIYTSVPVTSARGHVRWISQMAAFLARVLLSVDDFFGHVVPLLDCNPTFSARVLPLLVQALLVREDAPTGLQSPKAILSAFLTAVLRSPAAGVPIKEAVIDIVLHLRQVSVKWSKDLLAHEHWLEHDYLLLSRAAVECKAYTTALLFLELRHQAGHSTSNEEETQTLFGIYSNIEDPDGFYGVRSSDWQSSLLRKLHHEDRWNEAFAFHGADYRHAPSSTAVEGVYRSLHSFGFDKMALTLAQNGEPHSGSADVQDDLGYDLAWRTSTWDIPVTFTSSQSPSSNALLYSSLRAIHNERDSSLVRNIVCDAIQTEVGKMRSLSIESMSDLRGVQTTLICLKEIQSWVDLDLASNLRSDHLDKALPWFESEYEFSALEKLASVRSSLLQSVSSTRTSIVTDINPAVQDAQRYLQLKLSTSARAINKLQPAINAITLAQKFDNPAKPDPKVSHEFANVLWKSEEHATAIELQRQLLASSSPEPTDSALRVKRAEDLSLLGDWMSTARLDTAARTEAEYFAPAVNLIGSLPPSKEHGLIYHRFAVFAEEQSRTLEKSPEIHRLRLYNDRQRQEISQLTHSNGRPRINLPKDASGSSRYDKVVQSQQDDEDKIRAHEDALQALLRNAIAMYGRTLTVCDDFDDSLLRLASLWMGHHAREDLHANVKSIIASIPSHKFIRIANQLSARLDVTSTQFQRTLHSLFERLALEHPFHSLYQLLTLRGFDASSATKKDTDRRRSNGSRNSSTSSRGWEAAPRSGRSLAAENVLSKVVKKNTTAATRIRDVDLFCNAAIEWADVDVKALKPEPSTTGRKLYKMDKKLKIAHINNLAIPVPTLALDIDRTCRYKRVVTIGKFHELWETVGGLRLPKVTTCIGSDGRPYKQLYKSEDDMRQDAVMEQLFGIINELLVKDPKTRARHLHMTTYKVVPLGESVGFIEFVPNTIPIEGFLRNAHRRYHPEDLSFSTLRKEISQWQASYSPEKISKKFSEATSKIHPVMRHFFTEKHKTPLAWYTMRLNYSRSAATGSMVGHLVGLGDRHCSNILIHEKTGELVHIDLGIAFEAGRRLKIPELVPFRLTADIVDGLGMSGVEGVFRRCSEEALRVMRDAAGTIMTVLEVFKHDPMQGWGIDADKLARLQGNNEAVVDPDLIRDSTDEDADRALTSVRIKLDKSLSIEYTVNDLIQQARDPANLGSIFVGWQAWY